MRCAAMTSADGTRVEHTKRILQIIPAPFGWRAVVEANEGLCIYTRRKGEQPGHFVPRKMADVDLEQFTTEELGGIDHIIAWALVEEWADEVPDDDLEYHMLKPDERSFEIARFVHPVMVANGNCDRLIPLRILAPGEEIPEEELRALLLDAWRWNVEAETT